MNAYELYNHLAGGFSDPKKVAALQAPKPAPTPTPVATQPVSKPIGIPGQSAYYDPSRAYKYTAEQVREMRQRMQEATAPQYQEAGDGYADALEIEAEQADATDKAITDSRNGGGVSVDAPEVETEVTAPPANELVPISILGTLAYLLLF